MTPASTPTAPLHVRQGMTFRDWVTVGKRLASVSSASTWALGDWLLFGERTFGHRYRAALEVTNLDYQTLRNYAWVAGSFAPPRRRASLSFQHHAEVAAMADVEQDIWLQRADQGLLVAQRAAPPDQAPPRRPRPEIPGARAGRRPRGAHARGRAALEGRRRGHGIGLLEWLRSVANAAADEALQPALT